MSCTNLLATTQSHHIPYLDISQTQQAYFELSKDLNTIHAYGTLDRYLRGLNPTIKVQAMLHAPKTLEDAMRLAET